MISLAGYGQGPTSAAKASVVCFHADANARRLRVNRACARRLRCAAGNADVLFETRRLQIPESDEDRTGSVPSGLLISDLLRGGTPDSRSQTLESTRRFLRADEALSEESAEAITSVLRAAYDQLAQRQEVADPEPELAAAR